MTERRAYQIQGACKSGALDVWFMFRGASVVAVAMTRVFKDSILGQSLLQIVAVHAMEKLPSDAWSVGIRGLTQWARRMRCDALQAYTRSDRVIELAEQFGFDLDWRLIRKEV